MSSCYLANNDLLFDCQRVADYFAIVGLPNELNAASATPTAGATTETNKNELKSSASISSESSFNDEHILYPNYLEKSRYDKLDPIVDLAVLNKTLNESVPIGFECIWLTRAGYSANLNHSDAIFAKSSEIFLCFRRGRDKPPITDIGVFYEGKERVMNGCTIITKTVGDNSANVNNSSITGDRIFITFRRDNEFACNSLAVIDICVIIKSKGESAPHTFNEIDKNLNRGIFGSSVYLCYKKAWIPAPQIKYMPTVLYRYPSVDHVDIPFPSQIAMFGLPMGAVIESWPKNSMTTTTTMSNNVKPTSNTFVLNVNSEESSIPEKVYGATLIFYEDYDEKKLTGEQSLVLSYSSKLKNRTLHSNKALIILSRHPMFECFKDFLYFIYSKYSKCFNSSLKDLIPIEKYLSHFIYEVPFPTHQKPRVLVNLTDKEDDCLSIYLPNESILPECGASFIELLKNFGVDNSINVFMFVLLQRNLMIHSLRRAVLTGVIEAISCIIFPFIWRYSYLPMCPLNLYNLLEAPGSFILGMDSRFFDLFDPPENVTCVDLDTNMISWTPDRENLNLKILPKKALNTLRTRLGQLIDEIEDLYANFCNDHQQSMLSNKGVADSDARFKRRKRQIELLIREAYLKFMASILNNYKSFLRTVTRRPDSKAMDRNLAAFFDCEGFVQSKEASSRYFYKELIKTQLFYDFIMNITFATELEPSLADSFAFFAECCTKINTSKEEEKFLEMTESANDQTVVILPPTFELKNEEIQTNDSSIVDESTTTVANTTGFVLIKNSAFAYRWCAESVSTHQENHRICHGFPRLKYELGIPHSNSQDVSLNDLNTLNNQPNTQDSNSLSNSNSLATNRKDSATNQNLDVNNKQTAADAQSISSANTQTQMFGGANRKQKVPNTPIGVRTKAEKIQAQKKMDSILNSKAPTNLKLMEKHKFGIAKNRAMCFLSNAYALWFIYLAECLKVNEENRKLGLNYAYQILIQMQNHSVTQPDEICYRTMMQLCLLYKLPTLAVKTLLHMKIYKLELTPITYSYYNMVLIDPSNWPSFEQDRWAKLRLLWSVTWAFKYSLKIKREREEKLKKLNKKNKKTRNSNVNNNKNNNNRSGTGSNRRKTNTIKSKSATLSKTRTIRKENEKSLVVKPQHQQQQANTNQLSSRSSNDEYNQSLLPIHKPMSIDKPITASQNETIETRVIQTLNIETNEATASVVDGLSQLIETDQTILGTKSNENGVVGSHQHSAHGSHHHNQRNSNIYNSIARRQLKWSSSDGTTPKIAAEKLKKYRLSLTFTKNFDNLNKYALSYSSYQHFDSMHRGFDLISSQVGIIVIDRFLFNLIESTLNRSAAKNRPSISKMRKTKSLQKLDYSLKIKFNKNENKLPPSSASNESPTKSNELSHKSEENQIKQDPTPTPTPTPTQTPTPTPITINDPLGAFQIVNSSKETKLNNHLHSHHSNHHQQQQQDDQKQQQQLKQQQQDTNESEEIKKRLFDYKPFETIETQHKIKSNVKSSDFLFEKQSSPPPPPPTASAVASLGVSQVTTSTLVNPTKKADHSTTTTNYLTEKKYDLRNNNLIDSDLEYETNDFDEYDDDDEEEEEEEEEEDDDDDELNSDYDENTTDEDDDDDDDDDEDYEASDYDEDEDEHNEIATKRKNQEKTINKRNGISHNDNYNDVDDEDDDDDEAVVDNCVPITKTPTTRTTSNLNGGGGANSYNQLTNNTPTPTSTPNKNTNNSNSTFNSPNVPLVGSKFSSLFRKVGNSIEFNKIKGFINDKSQEIKDAIMNNAVSPLNQQEITSKLKSISGYQLRYLNDLVKSNSNLSGFTTSNSHSNLATFGNNKRLTPTNSFSSQTSLDTATGGHNTSTTFINSNNLDLEPFPDDESYKPLNIKWWGIKEDGSKLIENHDNGNVFYDDYANNDFLIDIQMSSCNFCENCKSYIYDEEIMSGWSLNDSDLNIKCTHCSAILVPKLFITIKDLDTLRKYIKISKRSESSSSSSKTSLNQSHPFLTPNESKSTSEASLNKSRSSSQIKLSTIDLTVQYLSPLVVRKELENIISNNKQEFLIDSKFIEKHSVIYWNLIWFFKRIGVDSAPLLDILLNNRIDQIRSQLINLSNGDELDTFNESSSHLNVDIESPFRFLTLFQTKIAKPYHQHAHVNVRCMWDNLKLQNINESNEMPLYLNWLNSENPLSQKQLKERLITALHSSELKSIRKSSTNPRSLAKLFELIIRNIKESDVGVPIKNILRERSISKINYSSIYREILYLVLVALERYLIDIDAFDNEYRKAFKKLISNEQSPDLIKTCDKPPNNVAVWCRRLFSPLLL